MYTHHGHPPAPAPYVPMQSTSSWQDAYAQREQPRTHAPPEPYSTEFFGGPPHSYHPPAPVPRALPANRFNPYPRPAPYGRPQAEVYGGHPLGYAPMPFPHEAYGAPSYGPVPVPHRRPSGHMVHALPRPGPLAPDSNQQRRRNYQKKPYPDGCHVCGISNTPEWRRGPSGLRTLCNACGLSAKKFKHPEAKNLDEVMQQLLEIARARQRKAEDFVLSPANVARVRASFKGEKDVVEPSSRSSASASPPHRELHLVASDKAYTDVEMDSATLLCSLGVVPAPPSRQHSHQLSAPLRPAPWDQAQSQRESDVVHALTLMREGTSPPSASSIVQLPSPGMFAHELPIDTHSAGVEVPRAHVADRPRSATEPRASSDERVRPVSRAASETDAVPRSSASTPRSPGGNIMSIAALCDEAAAAQ